MRRHLIDLRAPALRPVPGPQCDGVLVVFAGLAGTGKTTLSRRLAADLSAAVVRVDAIEVAVSTRSGPTMTWRWGQIRLTGPSRPPSSATAS